MFIPSECRLKRNVYKTEIRPPRETYPLDILFNKER